MVPKLGALTDEQKKAYREAVEAQEKLPEKYKENQMELDPSYDDEYVRDFFSKRGKAKRSKK